LNYTTEASHTQFLNLYDVINANFPYFNELLFHKESQCKSRITPDMVKLLLLQIALAELIAASVVLVIEMLLEVEDVDMCVDDSMHGSREEQI
jgi:hypothetical protein